MALRKSFQDVVRAGLETFLIGIIGVRLSVFSCALVFRQTGFEYLKA